MRYVGIYQNHDRYIASFFDEAYKLIRTVKGRWDTEYGINKLVSYLRNDDRIVSHSSYAFELIKAGFDIIIGTEDFIATLPGEDEEDESAAELAFYMVERRATPDSASLLKELEKAIELSETARETIRKWRES